MKIPRLFGLHAEPPRALEWILAAVPFAIMVAAYLFASSVRLADNPQDKLLPSVGTMIRAIGDLAFREDPRTGDYILWSDTGASLRRIAIGMSLSATTGLWLGLNMGLFPGLRAMLLSFTTFASIIPPLALLPILFITFGVDEAAKIALIFVGTVFTITRDLFQTVRALPREQIVSALTLGGTPLGIAYRVVLPQIMPRLLESVRLSLGAAWLFLIAAEAVASTNGLGYRIFLVRRYLSMDVIIPYVLWITFLGYAMDLALRRLVARRYGWYVATRD